MNWIGWFIWFNQRLFTHILGAVRFCVGENSFLFHSASYLRSVVLKHFSLKTELFLATSLILLVFSCFLCFLPESTESCPSILWEKHPWQLRVCTSNTNGSGASEWSKKLSVMSSSSQFEWSTLLHFFETCWVQSSYPSKHVPKFVNCFVFVLTSNLHWKFAWLKSRLIPAPLKYALWM